MLAWDQGSGNVSLENLFLRWHDTYVYEKQRANVARKPLLTRPEPWEWVCSPLYGFPFRRHYPPSVLRLRYSQYCHSQIFTKILTATPRLQLQDQRLPLPYSVSRRVATVVQTEYVIRNYSKHVEAKNFRDFITWILFYLNQKFIIFFFFFLLSLSLSFFID